MADVLNHDLLNPHERKAHIKAKKKEYKQRTKEQKKGKTARSARHSRNFRPIAVSAESPVILGY
jgi:hypothetical protein